jgi:hypothetical protein
LRLRRDVRRFIAHAAFPGIPCLDREDPIHGEWKPNARQDREPWTGLQTTEADLCSRALASTHALSSGFTPAFLCYSLGHTEAVRVSTLRGGAQQHAARH